MSQLNWYVGIDLGGTAIKMALITSQGEIKVKKEEPTTRIGGAIGVLEQMDQLIKQATETAGISRSAIKGIGIGAPAFLDLETGYVYESVNLGWKNFPLKERLESITGLPVFVDNDANVAALGEMWQGAGDGVKELLCITLGTGVGGGVITKGEIHPGFKGTSGEIGHVTVIPKGGYPCNCGKTGCIETIASATGIVRLATDALKEGKSSSLLAVQQEKGKLEAHDVTEAALAGDALAVDVIEQVAFYLGLTLGNYAIVMNPEKIVIGGGVSKAGEVLFKPIRQAYQYFAITRLTGEIEISAATLGNDAGVIGAAWLVHSKRS